MDRQNLLGVTLLVTALAFNPLIAENNLKIKTLVQKNRVTSKIASILHKRGLDEDAAKEISEGLVDEDEELFALMINNLLYDCNDLKSDEVYEYLSKAALHRKKIQLDSYSQLVSMVSNIKQKLLDKKTLEQLNTVAKSNAYIAQSYKQLKNKHLS